MLLAAAAILAIALLDLDPWLLSGVIAVSIYANLTRHPEAFRRRVDFGLILKTLFISIATPLLWYGIAEIAEQIVVGLLS
ncbi:MAG: hypothetical protein ACMVY4_12250 [Minwuia sp.]|uniref:hypothetical protein n=1 Tax=Minwuia sp. TaxID=2493630 RepID=UPI003A86C71A